MAEMPNNMSSIYFDDFLESLTQEDFICYPCEQDYKNLKIAIAEMNGVGPFNISLNFGSDQSIKNIFSLFQGKDCEVIFNNPAFPMYQVYSNTFNLIPRTASYKNYICELDDLISLINKNTRLLVLANPNSPYGDLKSKEQIKDLCKFLRSKNIFLLLDEAYIDFGGESCASLVDEFNNIFVTKTFSKAWGAAGVRCGYSISNLQNTHNLEKLRPSFPFTGPSIKYIKFLIDHPSIRKNFVQTITKEKELIHKLNIKNINIQSGAVSWINCSSSKNKIIREALDQENIAYKYIDDKYIRVGLYKGFSKLIEKIDFQLE